jgi:hypothetical protein
MRKYLILSALAAALPACAAAQSAKPFLGRWDVTVTSPSRSWGQWFELSERDGKLAGRIQPSGGAVREIIEARIEGADLVIVTAAATATAIATRPAQTWVLSTDSAALKGSQKNGENETAKLAAVRAPELKRPMPRAWSTPEPLFNGKDLTGWEALGQNTSYWVAREGELVNDNPGDRQKPGANIKTTRKFDDFQLHIEVNCPEHGNSGIYLRGRYEIQVGTEGGTQPKNEMGAVYGYYPAGGNVPLNLGNWSVFDITLVGRYVTVVRDGVKIHDNVEIPGITGGALDPNEGEPGPFFVQGDHQGVIRFRNITISVPKP